MSSVSLCTLSIDPLCMIADHTVQVTRGQAILNLACVSRSLNRSLRFGMPMVLSSAQCYWMLRRLDRLEGAELTAAFRGRGAGSVWDTALRLETQVSVDPAARIRVGWGVHILVSVCARWLASLSLDGRKEQHDATAVSALAGRLYADTCRSWTQLPVHARLAPLAHLLARAELCQPPREESDSDEGETSTTETDATPEEELARPGEGRYERMACFMAKLRVTGAFLAAALTVKWDEAHAHAHKKQLQRLLPLELQRAEFRCSAHPCPCCRLMHVHAIACYDFSRLRRQAVGE